MVHLWLLVGVGVYSLWGFQTVGAGNIREEAPQSRDYAVCLLTAQQKQKMLDEHNRFRGVVQPTAANMEYQVWNDDLANLAQMWTNRCTWSHGFVKFGDNYPRTPTAALRSDQLGQNLAREYGKLTDPEMRVEKWYNEVKNYRFNKYPDQCAPRRLCGHYTQLVWALSRNVGCGMNWCNKQFDSGYHPPSAPGETLVNCDYSSSGNVGGQYPYKIGTPCSRCASGRGWCYENLCRECKDHSGSCGTSLTQQMCSTDVQTMKKFCPKMCNLCECPLSCVNGGTLDKNKCTCACLTGWRPPSCSERCDDRHSRSTCKQFMADGRRCDQIYMQEYCTAACGMCDDGSGTGPVIVPSKTAPEPAPVPAPSPQTAGCTKDEYSRCLTWASEGECDWNRVWMTQHCCTSCDTWRQGECKDTNNQCPLWAVDGECEKNQRWMLTNCRMSCNQCKTCQDLVDTCPDMALGGQCKTSPSRMLNKCRRSCGLCRVYDKEAECAAWSAKGSCYGDNWTWMLNNCPLSCDIPLSGVQYCATKPDGQYATALTCKGYIECSSAVTKYAACPNGLAFDKSTRKCQPASKVQCED